MKSLLSNSVFFLMLFSFVSCQSGSQKNTSQPKEGKENKVENVVSDWTVDNVWAEAKSHVNKEVCLSGTVTHVCKHSGRQCFLAGTNPQKLLRVAAKGEIKSFDAELTGSIIKVTGILREDKTDEECINKMEEKIKEEEAAHGPDHEHNPGCQTTYEKVKALRSQVKNSPKGYIPIYFVEGIRYQVME